MKILEKLKMEWTETELEAFRTMWMKRVPIPEIAQQLGCNAAEVALLVIDQAEQEFIGEWGNELAEPIETVNIYGQTIRGCVIKENENTVIVEDMGGAHHVVRNEHMGKTIKKREKKHAEGFDRKRVEGYGHSPDKRAVHHYGRGPKAAGGAG